MLDLKLSSIITINLPTLILWQNTPSNPLETCLVLKVGAHSNLHSLWLPVLIELRTLSYDSISVRLGFNYKLACSTLSYGGVKIASRLAPEMSFVQRWFTAK